MADPTPSPEDLARHARQHLESLKAAGVEWLPTAPPPARRRKPAAAPPAEAAPAETASLFAGQPAAAAESAVSPEQRRHELTVLAERVGTCPRCAELVSTRTQTVFGTGPVDPELCLIGEAPGADEDRTGEPFVGAAGQLLNRILAACGFKREEVYICNIIKCLHGFTKVLTEDGWRQIQNVVSKRYPGKVAAVDASGRLVWSRITGYHRSPLAGRKLVKLCLHSARQGTRAAGGVFTDDHEVLTERGYKPIRELDTRSDRIHSGTFQPSAEVRQALVGMLLGDGGFSRKTNTFACAHGERQSDYLYHKAKILGVPESKVRPYSVTARRAGKAYPAVRFHCTANPYFRWLGKLFYPNGRKMITPDCLRDFSPISLAYLFMDDGYMRMRPGRAPLAEIATCCFSETEVQLLIAKIGELGIRAYMRQSGGRIRVHFDAENTARLSRLIAPYVIESMNQKLMPEHQSISKTTLAYAVEPFYDSFSVLPASATYIKSCRTVYCLGVERWENFVTHSGVVHNCRPPGNRTPRPDEAANCREYLERQLDLVRPKFICCLGGTAAQNLLGTTAPLGRLRGKFHSYQGIPVLCTYHPAFLLPHRSPGKKKDVWEDMKLLLKRMGRPVPPPGGAKPQ